MVLRQVRIGSHPDVVQYDDADFGSAVETDHFIKSTQAPVDPEDMIRLGDLPAGTAEILHSDNVIADHAVVRGDGGARKVQGSNVTIDDAGNITLEVIITSHDDITATSEGVAASIATETTFVTTNGDSDLDNVTLADGVEGQTKHIACVVEGNAADTWKITPANMVGGTQITFSGIGEGCTLKMYSAGWVVVGNNGGTIS